MKIIMTVLLCCFSIVAYPAEYRAIQIADGFRTPWSIEFIDAERMVVTEKKGVVSLFNPESGLRKELFRVTDVDDHGQGGLLDVAIAPVNQSDVLTLYFTYSKKTSDGTTVALASALLRGDQLSDWKDLFVADAISGTGRHFGSRITFADEAIYFSIGDRGERENGQNQNTHAGSILRLELDGTVPADNPFTGENGRSAIWSYGHRNPQGLFYDEQTRVLWSIEHGPRGGDEINLIEKGENYGWAKASHGKEYWGPIDVGDAKSLPGMKDPELVYVPSIAPGSLILYRGDRYPDLNGHLLAGALKLTHINVVSIGDDELVESKRLLSELNERIRDITVSPDDYIYFSTDSGRIFQLRPN